MDCIGNIYAQMLDGLPMPGEEMAKGLADNYLRRDGSFK